MSQGFVYDPQTGGSFSSDYSSLFSSQSSRQAAQQHEEEDDWIFATTRSSTSSASVNSPYRTHKIVAR